MKRRLILQAMPVFLAAPAVRANDRYPSKPITWICPYGAGGNADTRSRLVAKGMSAVLGQPIIVDNKAGAGGNIGTELIARAKPDGYTIGMGNFAPLSVNHALFKKLNFDPLNDISPITLIERGPLVLLIRAESPWKNAKDLVAAAKAEPGKLSYASGGIGGTHHLSAALFEHTAGIDMIHVPYKSGSAGASDLMGGQVQLMFEQMYSALPSLRSGKVRALAVTARKRNPLLPDVPTMAEQGFPEVEVLNWQGLVGPKGLSADLMATLGQACNKALADPDVREKITSQGNEVMGGTPEQFAALIRAESPRWGKVVRDARITPE
ncbi:MAG: tripartite tricarboxylate transporter substrate binding protein [Alphaproteobacteria bacterium]|nr:tripartite tricarboxylate transporter substrate binding protein [Alphaproteobacteria bacterium]